MGDVIQVRVFQVGENGGRKFIDESIWQRSHEFPPQNGASPRLTFFIFI